MKIEVKPGQKLHLLHSKGLFNYSAHFQKIASQNGWVGLTLESSEKVRPQLASHSSKAAAETLAR